MSRRCGPSKVERSEDGYFFSRLNGDNIVMFDECDIGRVREYYWYAQKVNGHIYAYTHEHDNCRKCILMHRLILGNDCHHVDHINGNGLDNRRCNLRSATSSQNAINAKVSSNNKLGVKGVSPFRRQFRAQIGVNGKCVYLGIYNTVEEAAAAYREASIKYFGEFTNESVLADRK